MTIASSASHGHDGAVLHVALAGTMEQVIRRHIGPAFTAATGCALDITRQPSVALANRIVTGELKPDPSMQDWYKTASYTNSHGQTFRGIYAAYAVIIPVAAASPIEAEAFLRFLLSENTMTMFERAGFHCFNELRAAGDETAIPQSIRSMLGQRNAGIWVRSDHCGN